MSIEIDTNEVAAKLSFLIGKTVLFRDSSGATCATLVNSIKVESKPGVNMVSLYYGLGIEHLTSSEDFKNIMLMNEQGCLESLGKITDNLGIVF